MAFLCERTDACDGAAGHRRYGSIAMRSESTAEAGPGGATEHDTCFAATRGWRAGLSPKERRLLIDEMAGMARLAVPVVATFMLEFFPRVVTVVLVGRVREHRGEGHDAGDDLEGQRLHLDAASLAVAFVNMVAMAPAIGILSAMDTLCSQAHGADQPAKMGTYALTGLAILSFMFATSAIVMWNVSDILILLGQPKEVSRLAGDFIRYQLPGIPFVYMYELIRKVFQSRNEATPMLISAVATNLVNVILGYYLVRRTSWGWMGAAAASSAGNIILIPTVLMGIFMTSSERRGAGNAEDLRIIPDEELNGQLFAIDPGGGVEIRCHKDKSKERQESDLDFLHHLWDGFVIDEALSLTAIVEFLVLGLPGMLQIMFEWCAFQVISLLCGILPGRDAIIGIGANTIIMSVGSVTYSFVLGASIAGSVRIGNALGAGDARRAEVASNLTLALSAVMGAIDAALLLSFRTSLPRLFTADFEIAAKAQHLFLIAAAFGLPDALNGAIQGIFRGSGRQALGAKVNFAALYIVGIPLGYLLGIKLGLGVEGLWWGMAVGLCVISIGCTRIVLQSDWVKLAEEARSRLDK